MNVEIRNINTGDTIKETKMTFIPTVGSGIHIPGRKGTLVVGSLLWIVDDGIEKVVIFVS